MTEGSSTRISPTTNEVPPARGEVPETQTASIATFGQGAGTIRLLMVLNLGLVALQALSAGLFLSGYQHAVALHSLGSYALQLGALVQAVTALVLRRQRRVPTWVVGGSIAFFLALFLQAGLGYGRRYWLHLPIGVALFGGLMRQLSRLSAPTRNRPLLQAKDPTTAS